MKECIWCLESENKTTFNKKAHTIPQSLGGKNICINVCDRCNLFFGSYNNSQAPVETVIKEAFNISRGRYLMADNEIGKNKSMPRFKSMYFNVDFKKAIIDVKSSYKYNQLGFQNNLCRQLKKGIYKIFLEERERVFQDGNDKGFDFIRNFCLSDNGDYPVFYFRRTNGIILMSMDWAKNPEMFFDGDMQFRYLVSDEIFFEFELLGHVFGIVKKSNWQDSFEKYIQSSLDLKKEQFNSMIPITKFYDVDFTLSILNDK